MKNILLLFNLIFVLTNNSFADHLLDSYQFQYFNVSNGLPTNYVYKIRQSNNKLFWLATNSGLVIFDSEHFNVKRPSIRYTGLKNENINALYLQNDSTIWVGTQSGGLSVYNTIRDQFTFIDGLTSEIKQKPIIRITAINEDKAGNIWCSTFNNGVVVINPKREIIKRFLPEVKVLHLTKDAFGNIWFSSFSKLYKYDPSEGRIIEIEYPFGEVMELYYDEPRDQLIIGSSYGLFKMKTSHMKIEPFPYCDNTPNMRGLNTLKVDQEGRIWVGSWTTGLFVSDKKQEVFTKLPLIKDFKMNSQYEAILDIFFDADNNILVGTANGGLVKLINEHSIKNYHNSSTNNIGLPDNNVLSIQKDKYGNLWCGTWGGGLSYLPKDSNRFITFSQSEGQKIREIIQWKDYIFYSGTRGVNVLDNTNNQKKYIGSYLKKVRVNSFYIDKNDILYIGTQMNGLIIQDLNNGLDFKDTIHYDPTNSNLVNNRVSAIGEDSSGTLWLGTFRGLQVFDRETKKFKEAYTQNNRNASSSLIVISLNFQQEGKLWCSTSQGLIKADIREGFKIEKVFKVADGMNNDYINGVAFDKTNRLWYSNTVGIGTISPNEKNILNIDSEKKVNNVMNNNAVFNDGEKIYFGGTNGLYILSPDKISLNSEKVPSILLTDLYINQQRIHVREEINGRVILPSAIDYREKIALKHDENTLSLKVISPNYHANSKIYYQFRVKELDKNWIENDENQLINLIDLKPSTYHLEVRSTYDHKTFSDTRKLLIDIHPPLWLTWWAKLIYLLLSVGVIYLVMRFIIMKSRLENDLKIEKIKNEQEHELNESKLMFFTNISHELRTPLTLIISPLSEIMGMDLGADLKNKISNINNNAQRLLGLINNLLDFRKAENGMLQLHKSEYNFDKFVDKIFINFKNISDHKKINFEFIRNTSNFTLAFDHDKMEMVVCNLLSNAFKFTKLKGTVQVIIDNNPEFATLIVKDTGKGISIVNQEKIFNRYYQIKDTDTINMMGTGLGLALTKKIVELHQGEIEISSEKGKGTEFLVKIPHTNLEVINEKEEEEIIVVHEEKRIENPSEKPRLLVVDDHQEIRDYLANLFKEQYQVTIAADGEEGKELALKLIPDLILTDVMMPKMNGIELCKKLKENIATAHIPVLLLTAKVDNKHEIEGLKSGADDYIRKPFDVNVLHTKVETQLQNRLKVQRYFQNKVRFEPNTNLNTENKEEKFLQDISEFINQNLENEQFHVEYLAEHFCMSQSTLYRKLKGMTGMTIAGFIRSIRLKKASELLLQEDLKLYIVGGVVGINDYKYFKKEFTKQFGVSPKEYREKKLKELEEQRS